MSNICLEKLEIHHLGVLKEYVNNYPPYSDFNVLNLYMWNIRGTTEVGFLNNNLIIKMKDYFSEQHFLTILGTNELEKTLKELFEEIQNNQDIYVQELRLIPDAVVTDVREKNIKGYTLMEDLDNHDYIISTEKLNSLKDSNLKSIRRTVTKFKELYPTHEIRKLNLEKDADIIIKLTKDWEKEKNIETEEDIVALNNLIKYSPNFKMLSVGVFIDNKLIGYTINELVQDDTAIGHFGKTYKEFKGSSNYLEHVTATYLLEIGYKYLNHEQDTGILPLRHAKLSYRPVYLLKKWKITKKEL